MKIWQIFCESSCWLRQTCPPPLSCLRPVPAAVNHISNRGRAENRRNEWWLCSSPSVFYIRKIIYFTDIFFFCFQWDMINFYSDFAMLLWKHCLYIHIKSWLIESYDTKKGRILTIHIPAPGQITFLFVLGAHAVLLTQLLFRLELNMMISVSLILFNFEDLALVCKLHCVCLFRYIKKK